MIEKHRSGFFTQVAEILRQSKQSVLRQVNSTMVITYFEIGRIIVEEEQSGKDRAGYGQQLLEELSKFLGNEFGRGFSTTNLEQMRLFYQSYSISQTVSGILESSQNQQTLSAELAIGQTVSGELESGKGIPQTASGILKSEEKSIQETQPAKSEEDRKRIPQTLSEDFSKQQTPSAELAKGQTVADELQPAQKPETPSRKFNLSWSHYLILMRIDDQQERSFYEIETAESNWSVRELKRQTDSALYQRLALSRDKEGVRKLSSEGQQILSAKDALKDPLILEFLNLPEHYSYSEKELEQALIDKLEHFLLELGKGFTFVARQKRISFDERHFHIDLVFYNRILKCFVLIDLKIGDLRHQDIGQMQMYVNYYDRKMRLEDEQKTIGIILCQDKSDALVEFTLPEDNDQIYASKYQTVLPSKEELKRLITE